MLIVQITDLHLGFEPDVPDELNARRLDAVIAGVAALDPAPDLVFATGDLTDRGDHASYRRVRAALAPLAVPVHPLLGNHDVRAAFADVFPERTLDGGFLHYVVDTPDLRLIALDTLEEGRHGGAFCAQRAAWLTARLDEAPELPTVILLHHPPCVTGIDWMDVDPAEPWLARLGAVLAGRSNIVALLAGHVHRPVAARWHGIPVVIAPSCAPEVALELARVDPDRPDGRRMIVASPPGYALHRWDGCDLVSHVVRVDDSAVLATFNDALQPMVREMFGERPGQGPR